MDISRFVNEDKVKNQKSSIWGVKRHNERWLKAQM